MKKKLTLLTILLILTLPIFGISMGFHTFEIRTSPEFSKGVFPTSLLYQFGIPVPDLPVGQTELNYRLDNGLSFRSLNQDPYTGIPFAAMSEIPDYPKTYLALYDEMNIVFGQGFLNSPLSKKNLLKLWFTIDLRFENFYEDFNYLVSPNNTEGLFHTLHNNKIVERFTDASWVGQPELQNNRSTQNMSLSIGFDINLMKDEITRRNGMYLSLWTRLNPQWFNIFDDNAADYNLFWANLKLSYTPYFLKMQGKRNTSWFSLVFDNDTTYRYINGSKVPYYIQGGYIYGLQSLNTEHILTNRTSLSIYGPQINSYDCYPYVSTFIDVSLSAGKLLNTQEDFIYIDTCAVVGVKFEFVIFNIANFYYEFGYIFDNILDLENTTKTRIGFSFGV